jgi:integrase
MTERITDKLVKNLPSPSSGNKITRDDQVRGFGIRITKSGSKSFILNYHVAGRERRYTIGSYPAWSVAAAREDAKRLKRLADQGVDPLDVREGNRKAPFVKDLWDRYKADHLPKLSDRSQRDQTSMWLKYILPEFGQTKLVNLTSEEVDRLHRNITQHAPTRANRVLEVLRTALNLAKRWEWIDRNPADGFQRNPEHPRENYLSMKQLNAVVEALVRMPNQSAANAIRLLILTGARRGEVLGAEWEDFDLNTGIWNKPSSKTKQRRAHRIPLSAEALELLKVMRSVAVSDLLFPTANDTAMQDIKRPWEWLKKETGIGSMRIHDIRHTFASILVSSGQNLSVIGRLLGHSQAQTTARYSHLFDDPLRDATNQVGNIMTGKKSK